MKFLIKLQIALDTTTINAKEVHQRLRPITNHVWDLIDYDNLTFLNKLQIALDTTTINTKETNFNGKLQCEPRLQQNITNCVFENKNKKNSSPIQNSNSTKLVMRKIKKNQRRKN